MSKSLKKWEVCIPVYESVSTKNRFEAVVPKLFASRDGSWMGRVVVWRLTLLVPTDEDDMHFHLSIEEYLHSLISLINELVSIHNLRNLPRNLFSPKSPSLPNRSTPI